MPGKTGSRKRSRCRYVAECTENAGNDTCHRRCRQGSGYRQDPPGMGCRPQDYRRPGRTVTGLRYRSVDHSRTYPCPDVYRRSRLDPDRGSKEEPTHAHSDYRQRRCHDSRTGQGMFREIRSRRHHDRTGQFRPSLDIQGSETLPPDRRTASSSFLQMENGCPAP